MQRSKNLLLALPLVLLGTALIYQKSRTGPEKTAVSPVASTVDWAGIRKELESENLGGRVDDSSAYGRYLTSLQSMDGPALVAAWDELKAAGLPTTTRERLEPSLLGTLLRKDVELALVRFASHVGDPAGGTGSQLFGGYRDLAERLPVKAAQWLDQNVAAGTFGTEEHPKLSGEVPVRVGYERELIRSQLSSAPGQAEARLMALPEKWRVVTLQGADSPRNQAAYAALVRKHLTPGQQLQEFSRMASSAAYHGGADGVRELLDRIGSSGDERDQLMRNIPEASVTPGR